jgi:hypothetical protein
MNSSYHLPREPRAAATPDSLADSIARQREALKTLLAEALGAAAHACGAVWGDRARMNAALAASFPQLPAGKYLYALDTNAVQISDTASRDGVLAVDFGRDRSHRPYMNERVPSAGFLLSQAYISQRTKRPSLTAIQLVRDAAGQVLGFVGADFDLRDLPITRELYAEPTYWRQIKGDPAIRSNVFQQSRVTSQMDEHIDTVLGVVEELITEHGVFHGKLHFSSSRATIWLTEDPLRYRLLDIDALTDPDTCLSWPRRPYPTDALTPQHAIRPILDNLAALRTMDDTFYLRAGSINIFNGLVGLTFSCDGSHYLPWDEFLNKGHNFWGNSPSTS